MMILNQGAYLRRDLRAFPAHKEELAHRPAKVSTATPHSGVLSSPIKVLPQRVQLISILGLHLHRDVSPVGSRDG